MNTLRQLRRSKNLSAIEVARAIQSDVGNVSRIERGKQHPTFRTAKKLAEFYGVTVGEIYNLLPLENALQSA
ncbi:hypothetical protein NFHSH190041_20220 [Shewanella sp. NFH-SH190041]|uniref:helix-turn-helix domain-containing protein n=1 Tax=Shewanella sp. NFH-SH190041 TaxID=2950245 RepID=UPI0021C3E7D5|nr:helix-turn-helix transcriptional regulator [Shewanella sp. NFH-SH190041]BDM64570.1 hypothetical protein NFHSH190041_20220 [Shewanella sp. NFH-SH190041]